MFTQTFWPRPSLLKALLRCADTCTTHEAKKCATEGEKRGGGSQCNRIQFHFCSLQFSQMCVRVCVKEHEVRVKIFKAFRVHYSVMSAGRRERTRSQANHHLPVPPSPPLITPPSPAALLFSFHPFTRPPLNSLSFVLPPLFQPREGERTS